MEKFTIEETPSGPLSENEKIAFLKERRKKFVREEVEKLAEDGIEEINPVDNEHSPDEA
jgi:hypothetical protein